MSFLEDVVLNEPFSLTVGEVDLHPVEAERFVSDILGYVLVGVRVTIEKFVCKCSIDEVVKTSSHVAVNVILEFGYDDFLARELGTLDFQCLCIEANKLLE